MTEKVIGTTLRAFWGSAVEGVAELDYTEALATFGLRFMPVEPQTADAPARPLFGATTRNDSGRLVVTRVQRGTPAYDAGIDADDEILALDDFRVQADQFTTRLDQYRPGDTVSMLVSRRERLQRISVTLASELPKRWRLEVDPAASEVQARQLARWLQPH